MTDELVSRVSKDNQAFTWEDVWFMQLNRLLQSRNSGQIDSYECHTSSMEISLSHKIDGEYEEELSKLEVYHKAKLISYQEFLIKQSKQLVKLLGRATEKKEDLTQFIEDSTIIKNISSEINKGIGQNLMITGSMGSGKSWASLKFAEEIVARTGGKFSPEYVVSDLHSFMTLYNDKEKCPPGSVIIFEEVGVNVNSKKSMTKLNLIFNDVFQTSRYKRLLLILNAPSVSFLDKTPRSLLHWWLQTDKLNKKGGICEVKPHLVQLDQISGELLFPYPRFNDGQRITRLKISVPSRELTTAYEAKAKAYKDKLAKGHLNTLDQSGFSGLELEYVRMRQSGKKQREVLDELSKSQGWGSRIERLAKERGIDLKEICNIKNKSSSTSESSQEINYIQEHKGDGNYDDEYDD